MDQNKLEQISNNENATIIADELDKVSAIEAFNLSKGGAILFKSLMSDAISSIDTLGFKYSTLTQQEFIALCADMKTKLDLARVMSKASKNKDQAQKDLEQALLEN